MVHVTTSASDRMTLCVLSRVYYWQCFVCLILLHEKDDPKELMNCKSANRRVTLSIMIIKCYWVYDMKP